MRILHLLNHCRWGHGNVHAAVDLACAQAAAGDVVCIASGGGEFAPLLAQVGVRHALLPQERRNPLSVARMLARLNGLVRDFQPDVIHAHMMTGAVIGWLVARPRRLALVTTVHNAFDGHALLMGLGDRVIAVSAAASKVMARKGVALSKQRVVLNGTLGAQRREFFGRHPARLLRPSITTLCGLHPRKGVDDLIAAFDRVARDRPDVHLYIAGDGPERQTYERQAAGLPCAARVHFVGGIQDTKSILDQTDIFALASHAEPFGLVIPEAREAGCAVVATEVDGIPEALDGGKAGLLVPVRDPRALAEALGSLLDDRAALEAMKAAARQGLAYWSVDRVAEDTRRVYRELVGAGR